MRRLETRISTDSLFIYGLANPICDAGHTLKCAFTFTFSTQNANHLVKQVESAWKQEIIIATS
jgi:hypothetical protein